jgi:Uma2 family endonuclease
MNRPATHIDAESPARFDVEEYLVIANSIEFAGKVELVDGVIVRMPPPNYPHFSVQRQVFRALDAIFGNGIDGYIVGQELFVRLGEATVRGPDVSIFRDPGSITGLPDRDVLLLAVEVSDSSLRDDLGPKRLNYAAAGIMEYWVVDINNRRVHRFTGPADGDYANEEKLDFGTPLPVPGTTNSIVLD